MFFSSHLLEAISYYRVVYTHNLELAKNVKDEEFITINWHVNIECDIKTVATTRYWKRNLLISEIQSQILSCQTMSWQKGTLKIISIARGHTSEETSKNAKEISQRCCLKSSFFWLQLRWQRVLIKTHSRNHKFDDDFMRSEWE